MQAQHRSFNSRLGFHPNGSRIRLETKPKEKNQQKMVKWQLMKQHEATSTVAGFFFPLLFLRGGKREEIYFVLATAPSGVHGHSGTSSKASPLTLTTENKYTCKSGGSHQASLSEAKRDTGRTFIDFYFILTSRRNLKRGVYPTTYFKELLWTF